MSALTAGYVAGVGVLVGLHVATWGAFKDSPFEGFRLSAFLRSVALAAVLALLLGATTGVADREAAVVLVGVVYALERLATEGWKLFLREDGRRYTIPMRFALRGRPVTARWPRYGFGASAVLALGALCVVVADSGLVLSLWGMVAMGSVGGWLTAVGGAWKDAPVEGFSGWKFLRSPTVAGMWALVLLPWTQDPVVLPVAAGGLAVASIETYKTFLTGGRPPGKFAGLPACADDDRAREGCRLVHSGVHLVCAVALTPVLLLPRSSVGSAQTLALLTMLVVSVSLALLVALAPRYPRRTDVRSRSSLSDRQEPHGVVDLRGQSARAGAAGRRLAALARRPAEHGARPGTGRGRQERPPRRLPVRARPGTRPDRLG